MVQLQESKETRHVTWRFDDKEINGIVVTGGRAKEKDIPIGLAATLSVCRSVMRLT